MTSTMTASSTPVRTRFAPSPTGFLHLGGARTALFAWAFAKHFGGTFILRIEDTDLERSTPEAVQAILDGMQWLGLTPDEGPFYQMQHMDRYREVIASMLAAGTAYYCYSSPEEVDAMRERARAKGENPVMTVPGGQSLAKPCPRSLQAACPLSVLKAHRVVRQPGSIWSRVQSALTTPSSMTW